MDLLPKVKISFTKKALKNKDFIILFALESAGFNFPNEVSQVLIVDIGVVDHVVVAAVRSSDQAGVRNQFLHGFGRFQRHGFHFAESQQGWHLESLAVRF